LYNWTFEGAAGVTELFKVSTGDNFTIDVDIITESIIFKPAANNATLLDIFGGNVTLKHLVMTIEAAGTNNVKTVNMSDGTLVITSSLRAEGTNGTATALDVQGGTVTFDINLEYELYSTSKNGLKMTAGTLNFNQTADSGAIKIWGADLPDSKTPLIYATQKTGYNSATLLERVSENVYYVGTQTATGIEITNTVITETNKDDVLGDGKVSFNTVTNILTLNNASYIAGSIKITDASDEVTIKLVGTNTFGYIYSYVEGIKLCFSGSGSLNVQGGNSGFAALEVATGDAVVTAKDSVTLTFTSSDKAAMSVKSLILNDTANVTATSTSSGYASHAGVTGAVTINDGATLTATGNAGCGIGSSTAATINQGTLIAISSSNSALQTRPTITSAATVTGGDSAPGTAVSDLTTYYNTNKYVKIVAQGATLTYSISLDATGTHTFTAITAGYDAQTAKTVTVSNTGTGATGDLTVALSCTNASSFTLNKTSISSIAISGSDTFTVVPNTGLTAGTYTATVTVSGTSVTSQTFDVSFTVNAAASNTQITSIVITGVTEPVAGEHPTTTGITGGTGYDIAPFWAIASSGVNLNTSDTFEAGETYCMYIGLTAQDGYEFANSMTTATINGNDAYYNQDYGTTYVRCNFTVAAATFVAVTGITDVPNAATAGTDLTLSGTVAPSDATNKTIVWSVKTAGTTGATIDGRHRYCDRNDYQWCNRKHKLYTGL